MHKQILSICCIYNIIYIYNTVSSQTVVNIGSLCGMSGPGKWLWKTMIDNAYSMSSICREGKLCLAISRNC